MIFVPPEKKPFIDLVQIRAEGAFGTGLLVGPGLVLTALHCVCALEGSPRPRARLGVYLLRDLWDGEEVHLQASIVWPRLVSLTERPPDVAVLRIDCDASPDALAEHRFGELPWVSTDGSARGFPKSAEGAELPGGRTERDQPGRVHFTSVTRRALTIDATGRHELEGWERWAGLSGGPLLANGLIVGVMRQVPDGWKGEAIEAEPLAPLLRDETDPSLRLLLGITLPLAETTTPGMFDRRSPSKSRPDLGTRLVPALPPNFINRTEELDTLIERFQTRKPPGMGLAIHGLGGVGKTTLAAALARSHEIAAECPDGILWATLGQEPQVLPLLATWLKILDAGEAAIWSIEAASLQLRTALHEKSCLLVVDDVWDQAHAKPFLVGGDTCRVIITTRRAQIADNLNADIWALGPFSSNQSIELVRTRAANALATPKDLELIHTLAERLGHLPLAMQLVGSLLNRSSPRLVDSRLSRMIGLGAGRGPSNESVSQAIDACLRLSLDFLRRDDETSWRRFLMIALGPPSAAIVAAGCAAIWGVSIDDAQVTIAILGDEALLIPETDGASRIHQLVRAVALNTIATNTGGLGTSLVDAHRGIVETILGRAVGGRWDEIPASELFQSHLLWHVIQGRDIQILEDILSQTTDDARHKWSSTSEIHDSIANFTSELIVAVKMIAEHFPDRVDLQITIALILSSIHSRYSKITPDILYFLVQYEVWSPSQALRWIDEFTDGWDKLECLISLSEGINAIQHSSTATQSLEYVKHKAIALATTFISDNAHDLIRKKSTSFFSRCLRLLSPADRKEEILRLLTRLESVDDKIEFYYHGIDEDIREDCEKPHPPIQELNSLGEKLHLASKLLTCAKGDDIQNASDAFLQLIIDTRVPFEVNEADMLDEPDFEELPRRAEDEPDFEELPRHPEDEPDFEELLRHAERDFGNSYPNSDSSSADNQSELFSKKIGGVIINVPVVIEDVTNDKPPEKEKLFSGDTHVWHDVNAVNDIMTALDYLPMEHLIKLDDFLKIVKGGVRERLSAILREKAAAPQRNRVGNQDLLRCFELLRDRDDGAIEHFATAISEIPSDTVEQTTLAWLPLWKILEEDQQRKSVETIITKHPRAIGALAMLDSLKSSKKRKIEDRLKNLSKLSRNEIASVIFICRDVYNLEADDVLLSGAHISDTKEQATCAYAFVRQVEGDVPIELLSHWADESLVGMQIAGLTGILSDLVSAVERGDLEDVIDAAVCADSEWWVVEAMTLMLWRIGKRRDFQAAVQASARIVNIDLRARLLGRIARRCADFGYYDVGIDAILGLPVGVLRSDELVRLSQHLSALGEFEHAKRAFSAIDQADSRDEALTLMALEFGALGRTAEALELIDLVSSEANQSRWRPLILAESEHLSSDLLVERRRLTQNRDGLASPSSRAVLALNYVENIASEHKVALRPRHELTASALGKLWTEPLPSGDPLILRLSRDGRSNLLKHLTKLAPVISSKGNAPAKIISAIRDVATWWP